MDDTAEAELAVLLERAARLLRHMTTAGDLSVAAAAALASLDTNGAARLTDLAARQRVSQPGMTQLVRRLEADGLVRRLADPADGRVVIVDITAEGRALLRHRREQRAVALGDLLGRLGGEDRAAIRAALPALHRLTDVAQAFSR